MKALNLKTLIVLALGLGGTSTFADSLLDDMNSLGGNKKLIRMAKDIDPDNKVRIVQNRLVDRNWRVELGVNYGAFHGGDPYLNTDQLGGSLDLHINPMFSVGFRYHNHSSTLSSEGERRVEQSRSASIVGGSAPAPQSDVPQESYLGVINIYPTYGKLNMLDLSVVHFDFYVLGGAGQMKLESGYSDTWTAGVGLGMWFTQHLSSRIEARYQTYEDRAFDQTRNLDFTVISASIGVML